ncbi:MAG TPA: STAS domain-containing protein [Polyangia bacterium]|nr:STAS domain-containing protein [Polyangia bacterium]
MFIEGVLDAVTVTEVRASLEAVVTDQTRIVVDLSRLRLIDSCGVGVLVALYKRARANNCSFLVTGATQQPLAILKLLNLDRVFTIDRREPVAVMRPLAAESAPTLRVGMLAAAS